MSFGALSDMPPLGVGTWQWGDTWFWGFGSDYDQIQVATKFFPLTWRVNRGQVVAATRTKRP